MDTDMENTEAPRRTKKVPGKRKGGTGDQVLVREEDCIYVVVPRPVKDLQEGPVHILPPDQQQQPTLTVSEDRLGFSNLGGFRSVRASRGVYTGTWYFEVEIRHLGPTGHCRVGMGTRKMELEGPFGYDEHGYGFRDVDGSKVHKGLREDYGCPFKEGDVVGVLIHLPPGGRPIEPVDPDIVRYKGGFYYVEAQEPVPQPLSGSFLEYSVNGVPLGPAYEGLLEGTYYPGASLYTLTGEQSEPAEAVFNFGPNFKGTPPQDALPHPPRPFCEVEQELLYRPPTRVPPVAA